ncbi:hypothetical protein [Pseudanabaena sp. BC1403]|nr:hypothetical protein [Pseudanabaena sp. BC1403]
MQFKAKTLEAINNSIENPNYQPNTQSSQVQDQSRGLTKDVESQIREDWH